MRDNGGEKQSSGIGNERGNENEQDEDDNFIGDVFSPPSTSSIELPRCATSSVSSPMRSLPRSTSPSRSRSSSRSIYSEETAAINTSKSFTLRDYQVNFDDYSYVGNSSYSPLNDADLGSPANNHNSNSHNSNNHNSNSSSGGDGDGRDGSLCQRFYLLPEL